MLTAGSDSQVVGADGPLFNDFAEIGQNPVTWTFTGLNTGEYTVTTHCWRANGTNLSVSAPGVAQAKIQSSSSTWPGLLQGEVFESQFDVDVVAGTPLVITTAASPNPGGGYDVQRITGFQIAIQDPCNFEPLDASPDPSWIEFKEDTDAFAADPTEPLGEHREKDIVVADFDNDGFDDLLSVRKEIRYGPGTDLVSHVLMMNEGGVLVDRSNMISTLADFPSRDVVVLHADDDEFLDFAVANTTRRTASTTLDFSPVMLFINLTQQGGPFGGFQGVPLPVNGCTPPPCASATCGIELRSCALAAGDVNGDDLDDLWITTYGDGGVPQQSETGDRLYLNTKATPGVFTDVSYTALGCDMVGSLGSTSAALFDFNLDGLLDLFRSGPNLGTEIFFNDGIDPMTMVPTFTRVDGIAAPGYMAAVGDLNFDGYPDIYTSTERCDAWDLNPGVDMNNDISPTDNTDWIESGTLSDNSVHNKVELVGGANVIFFDFDGNGRMDILTCNLDTSQLEAGNPNVKQPAPPSILRNRTITPGVFGGLEDEDSFEQLAINMNDDAWDAAIIDLDGKDGPGGPGVIYATETSYRYFERLPLALNYGTLTPNSVGPGAQIGFIGTPSKSESGLFLTAKQVPANTLGRFFVGSAMIAPMPYFDGNILVGGTVAYFDLQKADNSGQLAQRVDFTAPVMAAALPGETVYFQAFYRDGATSINLTDGLEMRIWE